MARPDDNRRQLKRLIQLALDYTGYNRAQLASALGRDATNLVPASGNPKLDYLIRLAGVLDWQVGDVVDLLTLDPDGSEEADGSAEEVAAQARADFQQSDAAALAAYEAGSFEKMIRLARHAGRVAQTPNERAKSLLREAGGWDGRGRYLDSLDALQQALDEPGIGRRMKRVLLSNLANTYYTIWRLNEGRALASELIAWFETHEPEELTDRSTQAFAFYVRGHCHRRMIGRGSPEESREHASAAVSDLKRSEEMHAGLAAEAGRDSFAGIANTCRGGLLESQVEAAEVTAAEALSQLLEGLDAVVESEQWPAGPGLESYGWWCIFGCNIALRHLDGAEQQRHMAVFTNKACEIADRLGNWAIHERILSLEKIRRARLGELTGIEPEWVIDREDIRVITGVMGRFGRFRREGWRIVQSARIVRD